MYFNFETVFAHVFPEIPKELVYVGRSTSASPAAGSSMEHASQSKNLFSEAFEGKKMPLPKQVQPPYLAE